MRGTVDNSLSPNPPEATDLLLYHLAIFIVQDPEVRSLHAT